jgi:selenocysteine lyase/cysteine desulfurase
MVALIPGGFSAIPVQAGSATPFDFTPRELSLAAGARRFELSTMSYSAAVGLLTSIKLLTGIGLTAISEHASRLAAVRGPGSLPPLP